MTNSAWTEDRVARLKILWHEGHTAEQIAGQLQNGITRSAVLGKVHRLGLSAGRPGRPVVRKAPERKAPRAPARLSHRVQEVGAATAGPVVREDLPSGGLSILTVRSGQCRWPYGDPRAGVTFCGRPVARGAFCAGHAEMGYRTPPGGPASLLALAGLA